MFDFDMEIERAFRAIELFALLVWALESTLDIVGTAPVMFLPARAISFALQPINVLIVKAFNFEHLR